ncbi:MAG: hypothetical protein QOJ42_6111 [Acidobacteriaceae bacterium]|jgi:hypothetical protein|nr:hypothetical protein [Acidobacteriaceae bacterium]
MTKGRTVVRKGRLLEERSVAKDPLPYNSPFLCHPACPGVPWERVHEAECFGSGAQLFGFVQFRVCDKQSQGLTLEQTFVCAFCPAD